MYKKFILIAICALYCLNQVSIAATTTKGLPQSGHTSHPHENPNLGEHHKSMGSSPRSTQSQTFHKHDKRQQKPDNNNQPKLTKAEQLFINNMVTKHHFNRKYVTALITSVKFLPRPIKHIKHPYEHHVWHIYHDTFITKARIDGGVKYWRRHAKTLARMQKEYHIPASIIVAIIGLESYYGQRLGTYPVLNALVTLAFYGSGQPTLFRYELEQFLLLTREQHLDPRKVHGSFAGALGYPQFMPSAYRANAIDYNGNGKIDLFHDTADVIGSVANFLKDLGWHKDEAILITAKVTGTKYKKILNLKLAPIYTVAKLKKYGVTPSKPLANNCRVNLIRLLTKHGYIYRLGLHNFYVITRYNLSKHYGVAIYQLAAKIKHAYADKHYVTKPS